MTVKDPKAHALHKHADWMDRQPGFHLRFFRSLCHIKCHIVSPEVFPSQNVTAYHITNYFPVSENIKNINIKLPLVLLKLQVEKNSR